MNRRRSSGSKVGALVLSIACAVVCLFVAGCISKRTDGSGRQWWDFKTGGVTNGVWTR